MAQSVPGFPASHFVLFFIPTFRSYCSPTITTLYVKLHVIFFSILIFDELFNNVTINIIFLGKFQTFKYSDIFAEYNFLTYLKALKSFNYLFTITPYTTTEFSSQL